MTRKNTVLILLFLLVFIVALARINKTIFPALRPIVSDVDLETIEETLPLQNFTIANGVDTFLKSTEGVSVAIYAKDLTSPRAMIFDKEERMIVSSNKHSEVIRISDTDYDGYAEKIEVLLNKQDRPHGILLHDGFLYIAEETLLSRYAYNERLGEQEKLLNFPKGGRHFTRSLATRNGKLFISVGSSCDTCLEDDERYATVIESNLDGTEPRVYASGLRNAVFIKINEYTGELFATEMGRDHLGDDLPPDEINIIKEGRGYGWPYCYGKQVYDTEFGGVNNCTKSESSFIDLPAHVSPLGFTFVPNSWGEEYAGDLLVAYHGSWNRTVPVGYKIERFRKTDSGYSEVGTTFLEGFLEDGEKGLGRPVDLIFDKDGTLYLSDDKVGIIYAIRKL